MNFKPMLAYKLKESDLPKLRFPLIVSPKIDGIRCCVIDGVAYSRTLKKIPNDYIRAQLFELWEINGKPFLMDGELTVGDSFQSCTSGIMTKKGEPKFRYSIFDWAQFYIFKEFNYIIRFQNIPYDNLLKAYEIKELWKLQNIEEEFIEQGYEGIILRNPNSPYKFGRSTFNEHGLMALKRFEDAEAKIIEFEQKYSNENELEYDERGYAKRSNHKDNMVPLNTLGAFLVEGINGKFKGVQFKIGTGKGLDDMARKDVWSNKDKWLNRIIKYKFQSTGSKDKPRIPTFEGIRMD